MLLLSSSFFSPLNLLNGLFFPLTLSPSPVLSIDFSSMELAFWEAELLLAFRLIFFISPESLWTVQSKKNSPLKFLNVCGKLTLERSFPLLFFFVILSVRAYCPFRSLLCIQFFFFMASMGWQLPFFLREIISDLSSCRLMRELPKKSLLAMVGMESRIGSKSQLWLPLRPHRFSWFQRLFVAWREWTSTNDLSASSKVTTNFDSKSLQNSSVLTDSMEE